MEQYFGPILAILTGWKIIVFYSSGKLKALVIKIISYFDRNYNLLFNAEKCIKTTYFGNKIPYNVILHHYRADSVFRCLGNDWYIILK
jgi:hypothetical protein